MTEQYQNATINVPGVRHVFPETRLAVDLSSTAVEPAFTPVPLSQSFASQGGPLEIAFSASATSPGLVGIIFQILLDGQVVFSRGTSGIIGLPIGIAFDFVTPASSGQHIVTVQWAKPFGAAPATTIDIPAATSPTVFGASLLVKELATQ
jgi:hypothetical protein